MATLSEKYIAGFTDADGSIQLLWRALDRADNDPTMRRAYLSLEWSQRSDRDDVLRQMKDQEGGTLYTSKCGKYSTLKLFGKPAEMLLYRIVKFLVVKRRYAEVVLELVRKPLPVEAAKAYLKIQRKQPADRMPNYPSRKWLAGYFDGDGCFGVRVPKNRNSAQITAEITASDYDSVGIELLCKCFGGSIAERTLNGGGKIRSWTLTMPPSKVQQFIGHFGKYMIVKKAQADFLMSCASVGHFRNGRHIKERMKQLKHSRTD